jgi:hypothetical protein
MTPFRKAIAITALASSALLAVGATAHARPGSGTSTAPVGSADAVLTDCFWGSDSPFIPFYGTWPAVVKSQNCIAFTLYSDGETFNGGSAQINLPAGITVSKKITGPTGGGMWFPPNTCEWSGSYSVLANGKAQTLRLNGLWCDEEDTLVAYFSARIANPANVDYLAFNALNQLSVWEQYNAVGDCWPALTGFPYVLGSFYQYTGSYMTYKGGTPYQLENANAYEPMPLVVAPDNDYYRWWQWIDAEFGSGCFMPS